MVEGGSWPETASQTAGPYVHIGLAPRAAGFSPYARELGQEIAGPDVEGERIRVEGCVFDGAGAPVGDVVIEVWQADAAGRHAHPEGGGMVAQSFRGWGRVVPDPATGEWGFDTVKPGRVEGPGGRPMAPHITFWLVARGINLGLCTRLYFDDETTANADCPVLALVEPATRRATLLARRLPSDGRPLYRFDIRLQGDRETVFLDI